MHQCVFGLLAKGCPRSVPIDSDTRKKNQYICWWIRFGSRISRVMLSCYGAKHSLYGDITLDRKPMTDDSDVMFFFCVAIEQWSKGIAILIPRNSVKDGQIVSSGGGGGESKRKREWEHIVLTEVIYKSVIECYCTNIAE